jgi:hypothetical protein
MAGAGSFLGNNSGRSAIENAQIASATALVFSWLGRINAINCISSTVMKPKSIQRKYSYGQKNLQTLFQECNI